MVSRLSFGIKMMIGTVVLVVLTVILMGGINLVRVNGAVTEMAEKMVGNAIDELFQTVKLQNEITQEKVVADLAYMDKVFEGYGQVALDPYQSVNMKITNQVTKQSETVDIPALVVGNQMITNNFDIVDSVQQAVGGTATIFQVLPGKLLRVSTNVRKLDGNRATGTYIPSSSPVYQTVMSGTTFRGKAFVVNAWYITAYKPIRDASGEIVAVIYVGRKILTPQLEALLKSVNIAGKGYVYVFNSKGQFLMHPDKKVLKTNINDYPFAGEFLEKKSHLHRYEFKGVNRVTDVRYFEPWDWYLSISLSDKEMKQGIDDQVLTNVLMAGGAALVLAIILSLVFSTLMVRPLKIMVAVTDRIRGGDMSARMDDSNGDETGQLARAFNGVLDDIAEAMDENEKYVTMLNAVPDPVFAVDETMNIIGANDATRALGGASKRGELKGTPCSSIFKTSVCGTPDCPIAVCRAGGGDAVELETIDINVNGETRTIKPYSKAIRNAEGEILGYMELARDVTELARKEREIQENLDHITDVNSQISEASKTLSSSMNNLSSQVAQVRSGADLQNQRSAETATAMEEMNATVLEVARNATEAAGNADEARMKAQNGADTVARMVSAITAVQTQALDLKGKMASLGDQAESIGTIMSVINDIADQTNLLALNAAIEAARAGDAGRGFAVVADEVRKLAEKTMGATKEVEAAIASIQEGTRDAISATEQAASDVSVTTELATESGEGLQEITELVESTSIQVQSIATAAEEQSATSDEINRAVEEVNQISTETADGMAAASEAVEELGALATHLQRLSEN